MQNLGLLIFRVLISVFMLVGHGLPKLQNFAEYSQKFPDLFGMGSKTNLVLAIGTEVFCSLLIILGLFTRFASTALLITMLVAAFYVHAADPWAKKEFALLYALPFMYFIFSGPGEYSIDHKIKR